MIPVSYFARSASPTPLLLPQKTKFNILTRSKIYISLDLHLKQNTFHTTIYLFIYWSTKLTLYLMQSFKIFRSNEIFNHTFDGQKYWQDSLTLDQALYVLKNFCFRKTVNMQSRSNNVSCSLFVTLPSTHNLHIDSRSCSWSWDPWLLLRVHYLFSQLQNSRLIKVVSGCDKSLNFCEVLVSPAEGSIQSE